MLTVKAGMTRADLLKVFTTEGGCRRAYSGPSSVGIARTSRLMWNSKRLAVEVETRTGE